MQKARVVNALLWSALEKLGYQAVNFIVVVVIARLLSPEDYGVIAMMTVFISIASVLVDSGFGAALIQKKDINEGDKSTVFYSNIFFALILYSLLFFSSPLISVFYKQPILAETLRILGFVVILDSLYLVHSSLMIKELKFKYTAIINTTSIVISGIVGVVLAYNGFGVWSLIFQQLSLSLTKGLLFWTLGDWKPKMIFDTSSFKQLFKFSSKLLLSSIFQNIYLNIYYLIIGKLFPAKNLGYYTQAKRINDIPVLTLVSLFNQVTYPVFSSLQDDNVKLKSWYRKNIKLTFFVVLPIVLSLLITSRPLVLVVFKEKWLPSVPLLQILCVSSIFYILDVLCMNLIKSKGRSDLFLKLEVVKKTFAILSILIALNWGVLGLCVGLTVTLIFSYGVDCYASGKLIDYSISEQFFDLSKIFLSGLVMVIVGFLIQNLLTIVPIINIFLSSFVSLLAYVFSSILLKTDEFYELKLLFINLISKILNKNDGN